LSIYQETARRYPQSDVRVETRFWMANCLEELDRLDEALREYRLLANSYPNPEVIKIKIHSIESRLKTVPGKETSTTRQTVGSE
jgi:hypothetical protein